MARELKKRTKSLNARIKAFEAPGGQAKGKHKHHRPGSLKK